MNFWKVGTGVIVVAGLAAVGFRVAQHLDADDLADEVEPASRPEPMGSAGDATNPLLLTVPDGFRPMRGDGWAFAVPADWTYQAPATSKRNVEEALRDIDAGVAVAVPKSLAAAHRGATRVTLIAEPFEGTSRELREVMTQALLPPIKLRRLAPRRVGAHDGWLFESEMRHGRTSIEGVSLVVGRAGLAYTLTCVVKGENAPVDELAVCRRVLDTFSLADSAR